MEEQTISLHEKLARYYTINQPTATQTAHFYGGNGFAVGVYEPLLSILANQLNIVSLGLRGEWIDKPTAQTLTRQEDAELLIEFIERTQDKPVIGLGHSQGATATALAAAKRPDLFSQLFLLEPVTYTKSQMQLYGFAPRAIKLTREPFKSTLQKQAIWPSVSDYYQFLRAHRAYKRISDTNLHIYATNSLEPLADGTFILKFPPEQELASYFSTPFIMDALAQIIRDNQVPLTLIIGKPSMFISEDVRKVWATFVPSEQIITLSDFGHLLPMEAPEPVSQLILGAL